MHRAYCPELPTQGKEARLSSEESHHLVHVLRAKAGEKLQLVDGKGSVAEATLLDASARGCRVEVLSVIQEGQASRVHLAFGITKGPALEFIIRRCAEVGVASFQPLVTQHSLHMSHWNECRWNKILVEVAKQCQATRFPTILNPVGLKEWLAERSSENTLVFCHEQRREAAVDLSQVTGEIELLTGSEGGWSEEEAQAIDEAGGKSLGLGAHRLRAETAALVGITLIKSEIGEMG